MKKVFIFFFTTILLLAEEQKHTFFSDLEQTPFSIIFFFLLWIFLAVKMTKNRVSKEMSNKNTKLTESNTKLTSELKKVTDILEKKEKE
jgi:fucose permease